MLGIFSALLMVSSDESFSIKSEQLDLLHNFMQNMIFCKEGGYCGREIFENFFKRYEGICVDDNNEVIVMEKSEKIRMGQVMWRSIPDTVTSIAFQGGDFSGYLNEGFPSALQSLILDNNVFTGSFLLELLPAHIEIIDVSMNALTGTINLGALSQSLHTFCASRNQFCGTISMKDLPRQIEVFVISRNALSGSVDFENLPSSVKKVDVSNNSLSGTPILSSIAPSIQLLSLMRNRFEGTSYVLKRLLKENRIRFQYNNNLSMGPLLSNDEQTMQGNNSRLKDFENVSMELFLPNEASPEANEWITLNQVDACLWLHAPPSTYFCCEGGFLSEVHISGIDAANFNVAFAPNAIVEFQIHDCKQLYQLNTRHLPRSARMIDLSSNFLFGKVDLRSLPRSLESVDFSKNGMQGPIVLDDLPENIRSINLERNAIKQKTLFYGKLPAVLEYVSLRGNKIRKVKSFIDPDEMPSSIISI